MNFERFLAVHSYLVTFFGRSSQFVKYNIKGERPQRKRSERTSFVISVDNMRLLRVAEAQKAFTLNNRGWSYTLSSGNALREFSKAA